MEKTVAIAVVAADARQKESAETKRKGLDCKGDFCELCRVVLVKCFGD